MNKREVILLARELFKIRITSSNEGAAEDDGMHKMQIKGIGFYNPKVIETWYQDAIETAEIILRVEEEYLKSR